MKEFLLQKSSIEGILIIATAIGYMLVAGELSIIAIISAIVGGVELSKNEEVHKS